MVANLYIHFPFCDGKCRYCGFYSTPATPSATAAYAQLPAEEARLRGFVGFAPRTVYFGGGTPGVLAPEDFEALARSLHGLAGIDLAQAEEWTVELAPNLASPDRLAALRRLGANRLSFGAQSFSDPVLRAMGRRHSAKDVADAFAFARRAGFEDVGLDLIAGWPGTDDAEWSRTLDAALSLDPQHVSVYALTIEPGTALAADIAAGRLAEPAPDELMDALAFAEGRLTAAGFSRYEISNYALPGRRCAHNLAVWRGEDYAGLGPAASSRLGLRRRTNAPDLAAYSTALAAKCLPPAENDETLSPEDDAVERFVFGLRTDEGVCPRDFARSHPALALRVAEHEATLSSYIPLGLVRESGSGRFSLTPRGREVCDSIIRDLL